MNPYTRKKQEADRARRESAAFWNDTDAWPADAPTHVFVARVVKLIANRDEVDRHAAQLQLREHCQHGRLNAAIMNAEGRFLPLSSQVWNTEKFCDWLQICKAKITEADEQVWRSPESPAPFCWLYIERSGVEALATGAALPIAPPPSVPTSAPASAAPNRQLRPSPKLDLAKKLIERAYPDGFTPAHKTVGIIKRAQQQYRKEDGARPSDDVIKRAAGRKK